MENKLFAYFDMNLSKAYPIVEGATYTETFNEEINSMNIMLDMVEESDRLYFDRPYHFVKIVNEIPDGETGLLFNGKNNIIMLVDTFSETKNSLGEKIYYRYEIQLMNCVKLLEKIQCPNLCITHSLTEGENEPIYVYIDRYMRLYSPKVKMSTDGETWSYEYLLKWDNICGIRNPEPTGEDDEWLVKPDPLFDIAAADMQMNEPTLREVITNLMIQVACIPILNFRTLSYINFRSIPNQSIINDDSGINFINHSGASDSYASDLVTSPSQALQEKNTVVADIVGFRDSANAIISQTKNLQLEVRYPIYKINEVRMRTTDNKDGWFKTVNQNAGRNIPVVMGLLITNSSDNSYKPFIRFIDEYRVGNQYYEGIWEMNINFLFAQLNASNLFHKGMIIGIRVHFCNYDNGVYTEVFQASSGASSWNINLGDESYLKEISLSSDKGFLMSDLSTESSTYRISVPGFRTCNYRWRSEFTTKVDVSTGGTQGDFRVAASHCWIEFTYYDSEREESTNHFVPMCKIKQRTANSVYYADIKTAISASLFGSYYDNDSISFSNLYPTSETPMNKLNIPANIGTYINITDCVVEQRKRRLLSGNYSLMQGVINNPNSTLKDLAKYVYGTMGYSIGDTKITGFSSTYSRAQMWWSITSSYFDNILTFINARKNDLQDFDYEEFLRTMDVQYNEYKYNCGYGDLNISIRNAFYVDLSGSTWDTSYNKMKFLFYIYYQPLNNFKYKATKENKNIPFSIEQLNQSSDGLSDFSRLTQNLQDTVNRIGNSADALPQTTDDIEKIYPLNSIYNDGHYDFTIFHRQFSIYEKYLQVTYTASENYVIKNYFTSIITKYRAYEYVDYNESIVRKENTKIYAYISDKHYYDGDDKLRLFNRFYSIDDLKRILKVDDLTNYLNRNLIYYSNVGIQYQYMASVVATGKSGYFLHTSLFNFEYANENYYEYEKLSRTEGEDSENHWIWEFRTGPLNTALANPSVSKNVNKYMVKSYYTYGPELIESIKNSILSQTEYFTTSQMKLLLKMNGSILKDGINYYRINITENDDLQNQIIGEDFVLRTSSLVSLFRYADSMIYKAYFEGRVSPNEMKFYSNRYINKFYLQKSTFSISLTQITDPDILDEIIENQNDKLTMFLSGLTSYDEVYSFKAKYVIKSSQNQNGFAEETKNEINTLVTNNGFAIYYQDYDNVSAGPQLQSLTVGTNANTPEGVGGYIQQWQIWDQDIYGESHQVFFAYQINMKQPQGTLTIDDYIAQLPVINAGWEYQPYTLIQLVDNNKSSDLKFTFYKDNSEVINQTLQVEYYGDDLIVNNNFVMHNRMIGTLRNLNYSIEKFEGFDLTNREFVLFSEKYDNIGDDRFLGIGSSPAPFEIGFDPNENTSYIDLDWDAIFPEVEQFKIAYCYYDSERSADVNCYDMIAFKRNGRSGVVRYYLTLNDTKTNDVWYFSDPDDLFEVRECKNGLERKLKDI